MNTKDNKTNGTQKLLIPGVLLGALMVWTGVMLMGVADIDFGVGLLISAVGAVIMFVSLAIIGRDTFLK